MKADPRRILEDAAQERFTCELFPRTGGTVRATFVRVEKGGVVLTTDDRDRRVASGEDLRVWFAVEGRPYTFDASVIRAGVPVPDRGQNGLLLGFIDRWSEGVGGGAREGRVLALEPPNGPPVSLLEPPARVLHLAIDGLSFTMPTDYKLVFVEQGAFLLLMGIPGRPPVACQCRVRALVPQEGYVVYDLAIIDVNDPDEHREVVEALDASLA